LFSGTAIVERCNAAAGKIAPAAATTQSHGNARQQENAVRAISDPNQRSSSIMLA
jgi:hypothetical protein